jgi:hypothetical protein
VRGSRRRAGKSEDPGAPPPDASADEATPADSDAPADAATPAGADSLGNPAVRRPVRRRRRRIVVGVVLALIVIWVAASALDVFLAARHVRQGANQVQDARSALSADGLLSGAPLTPLRAAEANFASAHSLLSSPLLWPVDVLPVLGRQLRSVQDLSTAAGQVSRTGIKTVGETKALLKLPHTAGPDRITTLRRLANLASSTHAALSHVDLGPSNALIGPLATQRTKFSNDLNQVQTTLERTAASARAAVSILTGPQQYLLLTGNNAEMRSGSGAFLEAGIVTTEDGNLHLEGLRQSATLTLPVGAVHVGGDLEARWGFQLPGVDWRNLGLTPQFDVNGALAARMWQADTGQHVNGVMALDVAGLQELLTVTGPVTTSGGTVVSAGNVDQLLLHDQYVGEGYSTTTKQVDAARVDQLGSLASAVMQALQTRPLDLHAMVDALSAATAGRHLMLWSANPSTEAIWRSTGVSGQLTADSLDADVINRGGNKLDQYLTVHSALHLVTHGGQTAATLTVTLANHTPPGQSPFIAGPYPGLGTTYGEYVGIVTANLPNDVRDLALVPGESAVVDGEEGNTLLVGVNVDLLAGATKQVVFHFSFPQAHGALTVIPSARIPSVAWNVDGTSFFDKSPHLVTW